VRDFVFPMFRANAVYEGEYLLGTSIARPLIAKRLVEIAQGDRRRHLARRHRQGQRPGPLRARRLRADAQREGHRAVARMGPAVARQAARLRRPARHPGRLQEAQGRRRALLDGRQPAAHLVRGRHPRGSELRARRFHVAPDRVAREGAGKPEYVELGFERGDIVAVNGKRLSPAKVLATLNRIGGRTASAASTWSRTATSA
jgi:argininosuccinate synthase